MAVKIAESLLSTLKLSDGVIMPMFGLGVWRCEPGEGKDTEVAVKAALKHGYVMIDTATFYKNESDVGRVIRDSGLDREKIFVVSKLWKSDHGYEQAKRGVQESVHRLNLKYIDLYLIHTPTGGQLVQTYKALCDAKDQGLIRSVGVSNFGIQHLEGLKAAGLPAPSVNQIELHVWQHKKELVDYCQANNIAVMGYSPMGKAKRMDDPVVLKLGQKYGKSIGQVMIRWSVQNGFITIPKSRSESRIVENSQVFDWAISEEDMQEISDFEQWNCAWDPTQEPFKG